MVDCPASTSLCLRVGGLLRVQLEKYLTLEHALDSLKTSAKAALASEVISFIDFHAIHKHTLSDSPSCPQLWELFIDCDVIIPKPSVPPRNAVVQKRVDALRIKFENESYRRMTEGISPPLSCGRCLPKTGSIHDLKCINRQILMFINFILVVAGAFVFGFYAANLFSYNGPVTIGYRIISGSIFALIVFIADVYFLVRNLDSLEAVS
ncbi:unnamed protein product [Protopolystoma xenopodis]|uniref:Transmembrane protein 199 n=1 Tax=Protopolystoma xenopodis TaxID=117903 RepID=A0A448WZ16_9PLAT|nr:unnamed protein product [Protopolystoma xenopodis]